MPKTATVTDQPLEPIAMNRADAARYIGIAPKTLANWATQGVGPRVTRLPTGAVVYRIDDLKSFVNGRKR